MYTTTSSVPLLRGDRLKQLTEPFDVVVIGAGAAGLVAAANAATGGGSVLLLEKNRKAGVKILMSGGTRCNITHATDERGIIQAFGKRGKFLHSALASLGPADVVRLIEDQGVSTKVEQTGKVFPVSDSAVDVRNAFLADSTAKRSSYFVGGKCRWCRARSRRILDHDR